ncbi:MAG: hypothetical protein BWY81_00701 [Firmicutes bacterium ADurb.Bin467]|nr:MAG: hypothetical protein BWY81_00701 [Firmicutes bacterium ADurb.Bin467]
MHYYTSDGMDCSEHAGIFRTRAAVRGLSRAGAVARPFARQAGEKAARPVASDARPEPPRRFPLRGRHGRAQLRRPDRHPGGEAAVRPTARHASGASDRRRQLEHPFDLRRADPRDPPRPAAGRPAVEGPPGRQIPLPRAGVRLALPHASYARRRVRACPDARVRPGHGRGRKTRVGPFGQGHRLRADVLEPDRRDLLRRRRRTARGDGDRGGRLPHTLGQRLLRAPPVPGRPRPPEKPVRSVQGRGHRGPRAAVHLDLEDHVRRRRRRRDGREPEEHRAAGGASALPDGLLRQGQPASPRAVFPGPRGGREAHGRARGDPTAEV